MGDTCQVATLRKPLEKEVLEPRPSSVTDVAARHPLSSMPHCIGEEYRIGNLDIWVIPEYAQTVLGVDPAVLQQQLEDNYPPLGVALAVLIFPIGVILCCTMKEKQCVICNRSFS